MDALTVTKEILGFFAILASAYVLGKLLSKIKLPAILGWLIAGIVFGPYLAGLVPVSFINHPIYRYFIHAFEVFAGLMVGRELSVRKLKSSGKEIIITTLFQSLGTFVVVTLIFLAALAIAHQPLYLAFIFGSIALATAPAPALSIVDQYKTDGPVTRTLIPMAALDDVVGVIVFFTVNAVVSSYFGAESLSWWKIVLMLFLPFIIGGVLGFFCSLMAKHIHQKWVSFFLMLFFQLGCLAIVYVSNTYLIGQDTINCFLTGMAFTAMVANLVPEKQEEQVEALYAPILSLSLLIVIVSLGMPLDVRTIKGAGVFTAVYIIARAIGKIGGASIGSKIMKAPKTVVHYLGLTLLPHSGVSLVFTGIALNTLQTADPNSASLLQGTIAAAAIINEIIAVILAKIGFTKAGELSQRGIYAGENEAPQGETASSSNK